MADESSKVSLDASQVIQEINKVGNAAKQASNDLVSLDVATERFTAALNKNERQSDKAKKMFADLAIGAKHFYDDFSRIAKENKDLIDPKAVNKAKQLMREVYGIAGQTKIFDRMATIEEGKAAVKRAQKTVQDVNKVLKTLGIKESSKLVGTGLDIEDQIQQIRKSSRTKTKPIVGIEELTAGAEAYQKQAEQLIANSARKVTNVALKASFSQYDEEVQRRAQVLGNALAVELAKIKDKTPEEILKGFTSSDIVRAAAMREKYTEVYKAYEKLVRLEDIAARKRDTEIKRANREDKKTKGLLAKQTAISTAQELGIVPDNVKNYALRVRLVRQARVVAEEYNKMKDTTGDDFTKITQKIRGGDKGIIEQYTDLSEAVRKYDQITKDAKDATKGLLISWQSFERLVLARIVTTVFYGSVKAILNMKDAAIELSKNIAEIQTISLKSKMTTDDWEKSVRRVSDAYNFMQADVAEGVYQTISNQVAFGQEAIDFLATVGPFAKATKSTLADSVELMSSVLNSFSLDVENTEEVAANLFKTIELGRVRAEEMANSYGRIGLMASQLGLSLEELNAMVTTLTVSGLKFERASTLITNVLNKLIKPGVDMQRTIESWGVSTGEAAIEVFGLAGVFERLQQASNFSLGELARDIDRIRATIGFAGIFSDLPRYKQHIEELRNSIGDYSKAVDIAMQSTGEVLTKQQNKIRNILIEANTGLLEWARSFNDLLGKGGTDIANLVEGVGKVTALPVALATAAGFIRNLAGSEIGLFNREKAKQALQDYAALRKSQKEILATKDLEQIKAMRKEFTLLGDATRGVGAVLTYLVANIGTVILIGTAIVFSAKYLAKLMTDYDRVIVKIPDKLKKISLEQQKQAILLRQNREETEKWVKAYDRMKMEKSILAMAKEVKAFQLAMKWTIADQEDLTNAMEETIGVLKDYLTDLKGFQEKSFLDVEDPKEALRRQTELLVQARNDYYRSLTEAPEISAEVLRNFTRIYSEFRSGSTEFSKDLQKLDALEQRSMNIPFNQEVDFKAWESIKQEQYKLLEKWGFVDPHTGFVINFDPAIIQRVESERKYWEQFMQQSMQTIAAASDVPFTGDLRKDIITAANAQKTLQRLNAEVLDVLNAQLKLSEEENVRRSDFEGLIAVLPTILQTAVAPYLSSSSPFGLAQENLIKMFEKIAGARFDLGKKTQEDQSITPTAANERFIKAQLSLRAGPTADIQNAIGRVTQAGTIGRFIESINTPNIVAQIPKLSSLLEDYNKIFATIDQKKPEEVKVETISQLANIAQNIAKEFTIVLEADIANTKDPILGYERDSILQDMAVQDLIEDRNRLSIAAIELTKSAEALKAGRFGDVGLSTAKQIEANKTKEMQAIADATARTAIITMQAVLQDPDLSPYAQTFVQTNQKLYDAVDKQTITVEKLDEYLKAQGITKDAYITAKGNIILTGVVPTYQAKGGMGPRGTDTVPAWLTPGEYVVNKESTKKYLPLLEQINAKGYAQGGVVDYSTFTEKDWLQAQQTLLAERGKIEQGSVGTEELAYNWVHRFDQLGTLANIILLGSGIGAIIGEGVAATTIFNPSALDLAITAKDWVDALKVASILPKLGLKGYQTVFPESAVAASEVFTDDFGEMIYNWWTTPKKSTAKLATTATQQIKANATKKYSELATGLLEQIIAAPNEIRSFSSNAFKDIFGVSWADTIKGLQETPKFKEVANQLNKEADYKKYGIGNAKINGRDVREELLAKRKKREQGFTTATIDGKEVITKRARVDELGSIDWAPYFGETYGSTPIASGISVWDSQQWMPYEAWLEINNSTIDQLRDRVFRNRHTVTKGRGEISKYYGEHKQKGTTSTIDKVTEFTPINEYMSYAWIDAKGKKCITDGVSWFTPENYERMFGSVDKPIQNRQIAREYAFANLQKKYENGQVMYFDGRSWWTKDEFMNWFARDYMTGSIPEQLVREDPTVKKFASGGWVGGSGNTDSIHAMLSPGEFVVKASAAREFGALLERVNAFAGAPRAPYTVAGQGFAQGGSVVNNYKTNNEVTIISSGHESIDARRMMSAINREQFRGTATIRG